MRAPASPFALAQAIAAFARVEDADFHAVAANARPALKVHLASVAKLVAATSARDRSRRGVA